MFEGAFSPWHLLILAVVIFVVVGPKRIASRFNDLGSSMRRLTDDEPPNSPGSAPAAAEAPPAKPSLAYRLGRFRQRRRRKAS